MAYVGNGAGHDVDEVNSFERLLRRLVLLKTFNYFSGRTNYFYRFSFCVAMNINYVNIFKQYCTI